MQGTTNVQFLRDAIEYHQIELQKVCGGQLQTSQAKFILISWNRKVPFSPPEDQQRVDAGWQMNHQI